MTHHCAPRALVARVAAIVGLVALVSSCASNDGRTLRPPRSDQGETIAAQTTSPAPEFAVTAPWADGDEIDARYTCAGDDLSPTLSWTAGPAGTVTYAVVMDDLDDPDARHWVLANIDAATLSLAEGTVPEGAVAASLADTDATYAGPCPDAGETHDFVITLFAVSQVLEAQPGDDPATLRAAIETAAIAESSTTFTVSG